jgi:hypothetical protein
LIGIASQGINSFVVPGFTIWITPAQVHMHLLVLLRAGMPRNKVVGDPGAHGAGMTGMQGMGVSTPNAAAVAAATVGLAIDWHIPNGMMLTIGTLSMIFAAGLTSAVTRGSTTINVEGAMPKLHCNIAPMLTF